MPQEILSATEVSEFKKNGLLILKSFYDVEHQIIPIQYSIYKIISLIIKKYDLPIEQKPFCSEFFDDGFQAVLKINRGYAAEIYDAVKQIPAFLRLISNEKNEQIISQLFNTDMPGIAAAGYGIRIDHPFEEKYRASWHQEFLSQLRSLEGVVYWSPLVPINSDLGPVELCLESHKEGVLPVRTNDPENPEKSGAYGLRLIDEEKYTSKYTKTSPLTKPGDLVIMDWHIMHRSGKNVSNRSRWSMQMRYFNFDNDFGKKISWRGSFAEGQNIESLLPEYIK